MLPRRDHRMSAPLAIHRGERTVHGFATGTWCPAEPDAGFLSPYMEDVAFHTERGGELVLNSTELRDAVDALLAAECEDADGP